jgi:hypothetical protein
MCNKYSEGLPWARYYGGNEYNDRVASMCMARALECCRLDPKEWGGRARRSRARPLFYYRGVDIAVLESSDECQNDVG